MVKVSPIRTESDYDAALERVALLMEVPSSDVMLDELEVLSALIEHYEERHYPIPPLDPEAAIEFRMDQMDLTRRDLIPYLGSRGRVSEVLSGKRPLTMGMARALHRHLAIPAESLIRSDSGPLDLSL
jgi:HTH-type transcriptional regulator/antitoxin HigA